MLKSTSYVRERAHREGARIAVILGSGLNDFVEDCVDVSSALSYAQIPDFPKSTVLGHKGNLVFGKVEDRPVICMQGRFHLYEGYSMQEITLPIRLMSELGVNTLIVTNASGGINKGFDPGDIMLIEDHINFMFNNPLIGHVVGPGGVRFPDMTNAYDPELIEKAEAAAKVVGVEIKKGVYVANTGPSFETPAEIRAYATLGADAVGMSTVPEVIVARQLGMRVLGLSLICNKAAGLSNKPLTEEEVYETALKVKKPFADLLKEIIRV